MAGTKEGCGSKAMLLTVKQIAERLNVSVSCVYELISEGILSCHRIGPRRGSVRVSEEELSRYLDACKKDSCIQQAPVCRATLRHITR